MLDTYETIELFGLTENDDCLPIPNDDELRDGIVREAFENLFGGLLPLIWFKASDFQSEPL